MEKRIEPAVPITLTGLFGPQSNLDAMAWQPFHPGIEIVPIYGDRATGPSAALLRYAPGAKLDWHNHVGFEHIIVLRGRQVDEFGEKSEGMIAVNPPGTGHSVVSPAGCVVLAIWERPVVFPPVAATDAAAIVAPVQRR